MAWLALVGLWASLAYAEPPPSKATCREARDRVMALLEAGDDEVWTLARETGERCAGVLSAGGKPVRWTRRAEALYGRGDYAAARPLFERSLAMREATMGPVHLDVASSLNDLGMLLRHVDTDNARPFYERSLAIREAALGPNHPNVATSLHNLALLLKVQGEYDAARPLYERSLAIQEAALGPDHPDVANTLNNLASLLDNQGDTDAARPLYERSLAIWEATLGPDHPSVGNSLNNLAMLHKYQGNYAAARPLLERSLAISEATLGPDHLDLATSLGNLASLIQHQGDYGGAHPLFERSLAIREAALGPDHPDVATSLNNLAMLLHDLGEYTDARPLYERSLAIDEAAMGPDHPFVATSLNNLAALLQDLGDYAAARLLYERSLAIDEAALGPDHPNVARGLHNLAGVLKDPGNYAAARPLYERSLAIREAALGPDHPLVANTLNNLAGLLVAQGDFAAARPLYERSLAILKTALGPDHRHVATTLNSLGWLLQTQGDYAGARPLYERSLAIYEAALGPQHIRVADSLNNLALLLQEQGNLGTARPLYERSLAIREAALGPNHTLVALSLSNLGLLHFLAGDYAAARPLYERSLAIDEAALGPDHASVGTTLNNLAGLLHYQGDRAAAGSLFERSLAIREAALGPNHPHVAISLDNLASLHLDLGDTAAARALIDRALPIALHTDDASTAWSVLAGGARQAAAEDHLTEAVLWGKLSVQRLEETRTGLRDADDTDAADSLARSYADTYRNLADRLVQLGRIPEAEHVLALLKQDEQHRFQQRSGGASDSIQLTPAEAKAVEDFRQTPFSDARELRTLRKLTARGGTLSPDRVARLAELEEAAAQRREAIRTAVAELRVDMAKAGTTEAYADMGLERLDRTKRLLKDLDAPGTVLLHAVVLDDHLTLLLTSPLEQVSERVELHAGELSAAIAALRQALKDPSADPRPAGKTLYDWLLRPLEEELADAGTTTVLTYLDGTLRYVPIAALHDGERFVAEKWATSVFTAASREDVLRMPDDDPYVAAFGASKGATVGEVTFTPLASVPGELDAVVEAVPGTRFLDEDFTAQRLADSLNGEVPWVHIATHFQFKAGATYADSFLLLGDGSTLSVQDLDQPRFPLGDVDLLALSACDTAMGDSPRADGSEVEGLAVVAQNKGAAAVVATLWPVADASTAAWMAALYAGQVAAPARGAVAVQRVQTAFLTGDISADELPADVRSSPLVAAPAVAKAPAGLEGWRHPYYWAPFVLYSAGR